MVLMIVAWSLIGLLLGASGAYLFPAAVAFVGGHELRERVGQWLMSSTMTLLGSAALVVKRHSGVSLRPTTQDAKLEADKLSVEGEQGHLKDTFSVKGYLTGNEFGIGIDEAPVYVSPLLAEIGEAAVDAKNRNRVGPQPDGGIRMDFEIPKAEQLPDIGRARHILMGSADLRDGVVAENWAKISQEKFHQNLGIRETLLLVGAFAAGVMLALMLSRYGGGGAGGVEVPIQLAASAWGVAL